MPPKLRQADVSVTLRTYGVEPRCIQTSGIFRLPAELIVEVLTYFGDPLYNIQRVKNCRAAHGIHGILVPEHVERLTVVRKLTMTCWHLRNMLFPLLWKYVEGCDLSGRYRGRWGRTVAPKNGLYAQLSYLLSNPTIGDYVQALSVDLDFTGNPKDLMTKFVDCLARLPNLRTLDIFSASHIGPITRGLRRKCARFPSIRELWIDRTLIKFIGSCPNVESITTTDGLCWKSAEVLGSHGKGLKKLKRVAWIYGENLLRGAVTEVVQGCPDLQEVCIRGTMTAVGRPVDTDAAEHLRSLKHLAVVDISFISYLLYAEESAPAGCELRRARVEKDLKAWKGHLIKVLKDSPSKERKLLRWKLSEWQIGSSSSKDMPVAVEDGELEVFPETSL